jgi:hypothetical protein
LGGSSLSSSVGTEESLKYWVLYLQAKIETKEWHCCYPRVQLNVIQTGKHILHIQECWTHGHTPTNVPGFYNHFIYIKSICQCFSNSCIMPHWWVWNFSAE